MVNVPGVAYANPEVEVESEIVTTGVSIPGNNRMLCILGEGSRREVLIGNALGKGKDGLNPEYTSTTNCDGRHFQLKNYPVFSNRTELLINGVPLSILEGTITAGEGFSNKFDCKLDPTTGQIELQTAHIVNQGGADYVPSTSNKGNGTFDTLTLIAENAPEETWTIRCSNTQLNSSGLPVTGNALFTVSGSVSGVSTTIWQSDGVLRDNGILRFAISEGSSVFHKGDTFTIKVSSGVLNAGVSFVAKYIAETDINSPQYFTSMDQVTAKHGLPTTNNTLSLGCQIAFANNTNGVYALQCAPGLPRRSTYTLIKTATGGTTTDDLSFPLPIGVVPDADSDVKFFTINNKTKVKTQITPNKVAFFQDGYATNPSSFITNVSHQYSYTVIMEHGLEKSGENATIKADTDPLIALLSDDFVIFDSDDLNANYKVEIFGSGKTNNSTTTGFSVIGVQGGKLKIQRTTGSFVDETGNTSLTWRLVNTDEAVKGATILFTTDLALGANIGLEAMIVDKRDAKFYDAGWSNALSKLESFEVDMVVPLPTQTMSAIIQNTLQHCLSMSQVSNHKERVLITGAMMGLLPENVIGTTKAAVEDLGILEGIQGDDIFEIQAGSIEDLSNYSVQDAFGSTYRCIYMYPDKIVVNVGGTNTFVHGFYMAPALGGWLSNQGNVAIPATNKTLSGFTILSDRAFPNQVAKNITKKGICLVEPVLGGGRIIWGKTTSASGFPEEEEISIVFIRDQISKVCREALKGFIGQAESPTLATALYNRIYGLCLGFIQQRIITQFRDIVVARDSVDPRQWNVKFGVMPVYPVNWVYVKFELGAF